MASKTTLIGKKRVVVTIDPAKLAEYVRQGNGPVVRDLLRRGEAVKIMAFRLSPKRTGRLSENIVKRVVELDGKPNVIVGVFNVPYARFVHEGTKPHDIYGNPYLAFENANGDTIIVRHVHHPGTKPNRFLVNALRAAR